MTKLAIVTGANKGIGFEVAKQLGECGVKVVLACRNELLAKKAVQSLKKSGLDIEYKQLDVSDDRSIDAFVDSFKAEYGKLDILVNNAGVQLMDGSIPYNQTARPTMKTNYYGALRLSVGLLPLLRASPCGRLVNVASGLGHLSSLSTPAEREAYSSSSLTLNRLNELVESFITNTEQRSSRTTGGYGVYSHSKVALIAATRVMARDPANANILINACCPGYCSTDLTHHAGPRSPQDGAKTPVMVALLPEGSTVTGRFFEDEAQSSW